MIGHCRRVSQPQLLRAATGTVSHITNCYAYSHTNLQLFSPVERRYDALMENGHEVKCIRLAPRQLLRVRDAAGRTVMCHAGEVWISQEGNPLDIFLRPGERHTFDGAGLALIGALKDMEDIWTGGTNLTVMSFASRKLME